MNLLQLNNGSKHFGLKTLFDDARFSINEGEHVGVIGPNGAGKTTLFKIIVGHESLDSGELITSQKLKVGYLEQEVHEPLHLSAEKFLDATASKPLWQLKALGKELGLKEEHFQKSFYELSGGYRMRMKLLSLIGNEPNLMLLDEPTNFLDLESILALERFLQSYEGAFLLISHDREFLRRTTDHTLEVELGEITKFPGHIDDYFEQKAMLREVLEAQAANQEVKRKQTQNFVDRFGAKATKARQAQSRLKMLEKMEKIEIKDLPTRARIKIPKPIHTGRETLSIQNAKLGYGDKVVVSDVNIRITRGSHLGVVGFNGAGKSTLLKSLAGRLPLIEGELNFGYQVSLSYFAQHIAEELNPECTVIEELRKTAHHELTEQDILNIAGSLLFSGDDLDKKVSILSGGEKSRVALGQILLKRSPLLIMDEPTNHLDFDTVEALTEALKNYEGSVVVVSHDRSFIGRIATQILEIRNGQAEIYPGSYDDYVWSLEKGSLKDRYQENQEETREIEETLQPRKVHRKDDVKKLKNELIRVRQSISQNEKELSEKTKRLEKLNDEILSATGDKAKEIAKELHTLGSSIAELEDQLLVDMERLEELESQR